MTKLGNAGIECYVNIINTYLSIFIITTDKYEAAQEPPKKPMEDVTVSTKGEAETEVQQNGDIPHKEAEYEPHVETGTYSKAPILNAALPRTIVIRDRGRFFMECSASGFPKPKG